MSVTGARLSEEYNCQDEPKRCKRQDVWTEKTLKILRKMTITVQSYWLPKFVRQGMERPFLKNLELE